MTQRKRQKGKIDVISLAGSEEDENLRAGNGQNEDKGKSQQL